MTVSAGAEIAGFILTVIDRCNGIQSVWLIGSRANGTASESCDWDLIAFGSKTVLDCLRRTLELHRPDVDFFVVTNGNEFENAWGGREKTGSLTHWKWQEISEVKAEYTEAKWVGDVENGEVIRKRKLALCLWRRPNAL